MKKILLILSFLLTVMLVLSCGTTSEAASEPAPAPVAEPAPAPVVEPAPAPAPVPEPVQKGLDAFPTGKWIDANWNAVWEFGLNSVRILDLNTGEELYNFEGKLTDYKLEPEGLGLKLTFKCDAAKRAYTFTKGLTGTDLGMDIVREWTPEGYTITMPFQK